MQIQVFTEPMMDRPSFTTREFQAQLQQLN